MLWSRAPSESPWANPLVRAEFRSISDFEGTDTLGAISPDGRFAAYYSERDGGLGIWVHQLGTTGLTKLTTSPLGAIGIGRHLGFTNDGAEVWFSQVRFQRMQRSPISGAGTPQAFLDESVTAVSWSHDGTRMVYFSGGDPGDPMYVADRAGGNPRLIHRDEPGHHNHEPV